MPFIPNSEYVGFQSLGPWTGGTKMHAPKIRNSPGTLLEPFAVGLQSWVNWGSRFFLGYPGYPLCEFVEKHCWNKVQLQDLEVRLKEKTEGDT